VVIIVSVSAMIWTDCPFSGKEIMPIFSYLAYPVNGEKKKLLDDLSAMDHCQVIPAENQEILILITDTPNEAQEKALQHRLKALKSLQSLGMTFGHTDDLRQP